MNENILKKLQKEIKKAYKLNEIPVAALIVNENNKIISSSHNNRQTRHNVMGHAEINAIIKAEKKLKDWRLDDCTMYVTLEPCEMCKIIIKQARIKKVVYMLPTTKKTNNYNIYYERTKIDKICEKYFMSFFKKMR